MQGDQSLPGTLAGNHHWSQRDKQVSGPAGRKNAHSDAIMTTTDAHLLAAFRSGDEAAFATLTERYRTAITSACQRQAPPGEIDDCIQAVFLVLARRPAAAAQAPILLAWLHRVAHYVCRDARRAATRRKQMATAAAQPVSVGNAPEAAVLEQLDAALLRLEERQRAAVLLHASGNGNDAIAKSLGVTAANASKLVQRGLSGLRDCLCRNGAPISAAILLTLITGKHAAAATAIPLTISALSSTSLSANVTLLAKGTLMHLTMTATSTWIIAASLTASLCLGGIVAAEVLTPPPTPPTASENQKPTPVPSPIVVPQENKTEDALSKKITFEFADTEFSDVVQFLQQLTSLNFIIHPQVIEAGSLPVTLKGEDMSVKSVLNILMTTSRLRYELIDDAVFITLQPKDDKGLFEETEKLLADSEVIGAAGETKWGKDILEKFDKNITVDFQDAKLEDVIQFLAQLSKTNFILDPAVIAAGAPPVTIKVSDMKLRYFCNHLIRVTKLRYHLRDECVFITMKKEGKEVQ